MSTKDKATAEALIPRFEIERLLNKGSPNLLSSSPLLLVRAALTEVFLMALQINMTAA